MKIVAVASPNFNHRPVGMPVDCIVLHADASADAQASVSWIRSKESKVSYHVLVDRDGTVFRFVETANRAWHAGGSIFQGRANCNDYSIGISFANRNDGKEPYTETQYEIGAVLIAAWMRVHPNITTNRITTHAVVRDAWREHHPDAEIKTDPGPLFSVPYLIELVQTELAKSSLAQEPA